MVHTPSQALNQTVNLTAKHWLMCSGLMGMQLDVVRGTQLNKISPNPQKDGESDIR